MNGKSCIFSPQFKGKSQKSSKKPKAFVIMPFAPNFKAFYDWKFKSLLENKFEMVIQMADEVRNIGYIICDKVCSEIQTSQLILADITLNNHNVFSELGLASGLEQPIIL